MRSLLFLALWVIILFPAAAKPSPQSRLVGVSIPLTGLSATYQYATADASLEQIYQWVKTTLRRLEPVYLVQRNAYAIPIYAGTRLNYIQVTLTISTSTTGYRHEVSDVCYQGKAIGSKKAAKTAD